MEYEDIAGEFGWSLFCNCPFTFRMFAGVEYARIKEQFHVDYTMPAGDPDLEDFNCIIMRPKMHGIGPRIGFNGLWDLWCGFGIIGKFSTALLVSKLQGNLFQEIISPELEIDFNWSEKYCNVNALIPSLFAKLGLRWATECFDCLTFAIEGGYQAVHYFSALQKLKMIPFGENASGFSPSFMQTDNFGLDGYFLNASLSF